MFRRSPNAGPFATLFADHFDPIYRFAASRVGHDAATDIAAETFAQALRSVDRLDPTRDARPWLFGIANNVIRHHRRAEKRRLRAYAALERQPDHAGRHGHPESETLMRARLVDALVRLDARDRDALLLFAWAELTYEQVATALDIPLGTVRSRIHRARCVLRESLADSSVSGSQLAVVGREEARRG
jgi:RNA polymerase sigma-70 factor (ECF subfamily)